MTDLTRLLELARSQGGVVTTQQARTLGWCRRTLARAVTRRELLRLCRSVYADPTALPDGLTKGRAIALKHQLTCRGLLLVYPDAVLSGCSAAVAHDLPVFARTLSRCRLERPLEHQVDTQAACIRPRTPGAPVSTGIGPAVDVARAVVQIACDDGATAAVVAADAALNRGLTTEAEIANVVDEVTGWPGSSHAAAMLTLVDGRSESMGESRVRVLCAGWGISVIPQFVIKDEKGQFVARVDLRVEGVKVVLEFDGAVKYSKDDHVASATVLKEKKREDRIRRLGFIVVRISWSDLDDPTALLARIRAAAATARSTPSPLAG